MPWIATRPTSMVNTYATIVGCANTFNVASSAPDTSDCASWHPNSAGTARLQWKAWQSTLHLANSWYDFGIRISCKSMGTSYFSFDYSVDSGQNWATLISSVGGSNLAATTLTRSLASTIVPSSVWIRMSQTNVHSRGRAQLWDVYLVSSYTATSVAIGDQLGVTDERYQVHSVAIYSYSATPYEAMGVTYNASRTMQYVRRPR